VDELLPCLLSDGNSVEHKTKAASAVTIGVAGPVNNTLCLGARCRIGGVWADAVESRPGAFLFTVQYEL
jgi:hypothetical protein